MMSYFRRLILGLLLLNLVMIPATWLAAAPAGSNSAQVATDPASEAATFDSLVISRTAAASAAALDYRVYLPVIKRNSPAIYWGSYVAANIYGIPILPPWDMSAVDVFEAHAGKKISILHWGRRWHTTTGQYYGFDAALMEAVRQRGYLSLLDWTSWAYGQGAHDDAPLFSLSQIISGTHDAYIQQWATAASNWGHPFFLRFNYEMNGDWFPWSEVYNGNSPGQYVQAWRHVHDIFTQVGANNVTWVWCPNIELIDSIPLEGLYPGDAYVDWTCIDGYNWGPEPNHGGRWWNFYDIFKPTYDHILAIAPDKPLMIGETASTELNGSKAAWITDALTVQMPRNFPKAKAFLWFNVGADNMDWFIESSPAAQAAFAAGIASGYYATNEFANLNISPIPPLE
jgi:Glycosyl hydrolase family 26